MVSAISTSNNYFLQPSLVEMHRKSLEYLSATILWKRELGFFQKLLDKSAPKFSSVEEKKLMGHFQSLITYYSGELVDLLHKKIREHEHGLALILQKQTESDAPYFAEHHDLLTQMESFSKSYDEFRHDFYDFVEKTI